MVETVLLVLVLVGVPGLLAVAIAIVARRFARGSRELGTDVELATYTTLHRASRVAEYLRGGLDAGDPVRAARELRALLDADVLALADEFEVLAVDGGGDAHRAAAEHLAAEVRASGRPQVFRDAVGSGRDVSDAVAAPIVASGRIAGAVVAFAPHVRPGLVRATEEVAAWVAAQLALAELDASRAALAETELRALRTQISPHFIYNALNAIASFIHTDPREARELVLDFADFTRYSFRQHGDFTTIADELHSIDNYLRLERARFGERLSVTLQIAPEVLSTVIPFLTVQPLVENAVRHGLESKVEGGLVTITASDDGAYAQITAEDNGVGIDPELVRAVLAGHSRGEHVGLHNVDARLRQVYGDELGLVVETNVGSGTLVTMRVPKSQPGNEPNVGPMR